MAPVLLAAIPMAAGLEWVLARARRRAGEAEEREAARQEDP
jgi:hypothetical protein